MTQYVALLRGINVGGKNLIRMPDLKRFFEDQGFGEVETYIQSGNVLFKADGWQSGQLAARLEDGLSEAFGYRHQRTGAVAPSRVVVRSHDQMRDVVEKAPPGFGTQPELYLYDALFLRAITAEEALRDVRTREGVDQVFPGEGLCYFARLRSRATQSYLNKVAALPVYQEMTIRNWNTTVKLLSMMDARAAD